VEAFGISRNIFRTWLKVNDLPGEAFKGYPETHPYRVHLPARTSNGESPRAPASEFAIAPKLAAKDLAGYAQDRLAAAVLLLALTGGHPAGVQAKAFLVFWACLAVAALALRNARLNWNLWPSPRAMAAAAVTAILLVGMWQQWAVARTNPNPHPGSYRHAAWSTAPGGWPIATEI
jgi:hypothetical protein